MKNIQLVESPAKSYTDYCILYYKIKGTTKGILSLLKFCERIKAGKAVTFSDSSKEIYKLNKTKKPTIISFRKIDY